jgi:hypothetical protein
VIANRLPKRRAVLERPCNRIGIRPPRQPLLDVGNGSTRPGDSPDMPCRVVVARAFAPFTAAVKLILSRKGARPRWTSAVSLPALGVTVADWWSARSRSIGARWLASLSLVRRTACLAHPPLRPEPGTVHYLAENLGARARGVRLMRWSPPRGPRCSRRFARRALGRDLVRANSAGATRVDPLRAPSRGWVQLRLPRREDRRTG